MSKILYVGNLSSNTSDHSLLNVFSQFGTVFSARVERDNNTGISRGFGYVTMNQGDANNAMNAMNDQEIDGRRVKVNFANDRSSSGGYGGGGYGSGGGYNGGNSFGGYGSGY